MLIGILQCGHFLEARSGGNDDYDALFERMLRPHGFEFRTSNVVDMEFPQSPEDADGWLITGSPHGAYDDLPFIAPLEAFIDAVFNAARPIVGICFGHQIMAQALGGRVERSEGGWTAGHQTYDFGGAQIALNAWHQDQVVTAPEGATILASNAACAHAALVYGDIGLSFQAHPEFGLGEVAALIDARQDVIGPDRAAAATKGLGQPVHNDAIADQIAAFFKGPHG